jgi:LysM repeat protein
MHIVSRGETLSAIAASCGVTLRDLMELNSISDPNRIVEGQRILLSAGSQRRQPEQKATPQPPLRTPSSTPTRSQFDIDLLNLFDNDELFVGNN